MVSYAILSEVVVETIEVLQEMGASSTGLQKYSSIIPLLHSEDLGCDFYSLYLSILLFDLINFYGRLPNQLSVQVFPRGRPLSIIGQSHEWCKDCRFTTDLVRGGLMRGSEEYICVFKWFQ